MFDSSSSQPGFLHRCSLPSVQRKWISGGAEKVFLEIFVSLGAPIPLIPERLCSAQRNKETARIYCCILREVLALLHSQKHLLLLQTPSEACADSGISHHHLQRLGKQGGCGESPGTRCGLGSGGTCAPLCAEHPWERQGSGS